MAPDGRHSVLVIGDLLLDVVVAPERPLGSDALSLDHARARIAFEIGGAGAHLALAAADLGAEHVVLLTGVSLGHEVGALAPFMVDRIRGRGVDVIANEIPEASGGATVIVQLDGHRRLMLADPGACDFPFTDETLAQGERALRQSGLLVVSGHSLFRDGSGTGTLSLMRAATSLRVPVALDLVPHSAHRFVTREQFRSYLENVSFLSAEVNTLLAFLDQPRWPEIGEDGLSAALTPVLTQLDGLLICFPDLSHWLVDSSGRRQVLPAAPPLEARRPGHTDRTLIATLSTRYVIAVPAGG